MTSTSYLEQQLRSLRMAETAGRLPELITEAERRDVSYHEFLESILNFEQKRREEKQIERFMKWAAFPYHKTLEEFDVREQASLSQKQLNQLKELTWMEQLYNIIFLGPPGSGKTHLSIGLGMEAINRGYQVSFLPMGELIHILKTTEIIRKSQMRKRRILKSDLVIIDDLMYMAMNQNEANLFFQLINELYDQSSLIFTSNKGPNDWGDLLGDPSITTAILDRILHRAEVVHLDGDSYRMKHRKSIFGDEEDADIYMVT
ncbi:IS21-like element helper ATPase IstB [Virgibacillus sp. CBA3643]|uniref:IS21-like element helper ATPase IstB n=1 Tax=Virgibacillus sp. CBA3643 TaxID=2942278 RepID=UPI0035A3C8C9